MDKKYITHVLREGNQGCFTDSETIAGFTGITVEKANDILETIGGINNLRFYDWMSAQTFLGLTTAQARRLIMGVSFAHRLQSAAKNELVEITSPHDAFCVVSPYLSGLTREEMCVVLINSKRKVVHVECLYKGTINSIEIRPAEILRCVLLYNVPSFVLAHNHPSGDVTPSPKDMEVTEKLIWAADIMNVNFLDHIITGSEDKYGKSFFSIKDEGTIKKGGWSD